MRRFISCIPCAILILSFGAPRHADAQTDPDAKQFAARVVAAINSRSVANRKALAYPGSKACADGPYFTEASVRQSRNTIPASYHVSLTAADTVPIFGDKFTYAIKPTHLLHIEFSTAPYSVTELVLQVVHVNDNWYEVVPCPTAATLLEIQKADATRAANAGRVRDLVASTTPVLRTEILQLYKAGHTIDAYKRFAAARGVDLTLAVDAVDALAKEDH